MVTMDMFRNEENTQSFAAGQKIFNEGETGELMYVVAKG